MSYPSIIYLSKASKHTKRANQLKSYNIHNIAGSNLHSRCDYQRLQLQLRRQVAAIIVTIPCIHGVTDSLAVLELITSALCC